MDKRIKNTTDIETNNDYVVKRATHIEDITVTDICDKSDIVRRTFTHISMINMI